MLQCRWPNPPLLSPLSWSSQKELPFSTFSYAINNKQTPKNRWLKRIDLLCMDNLEHYDLDNQEHCKRRQWWIELKIIPKVLSRQLEIMSSLSRTWYFEFLCMATLFNHISYFVLSIVNINNFAIVKIKINLYFIIKFKKWIASILQKLTVLMNSSRD